MRSWDSHGIGETSGYGIEDGIAQNPHGIRARIARDSKTRHDGINHPPYRGWYPKPTNQNHQNGHSAERGGGMIDLDRLREARDDLNRTGREMEPLSLVVVEQAVEVLADAPVVWWCDCFPPYGWTRGQGFGRPPEDCLDGDDCGWVALVPVVGGQE